jgi:hypothetical protein
MCLRKQNDVQYLYLTVTPTRRTDIHRNIVNELHSFSNSTVIFLNLIFFTY